MTLIDMPDGRSLDIDDRGGDGAVLLFHHGTPGSVRGLGRIAEAARRNGLRAVGYSRAGYGESTRHPGRTVADVAADMEAILDHLGVERCVVAGWSGGGPHALATAALLPERVAGVLSIAGVGPYGVRDLNVLAGMGEQNVEEFDAALAGENVLRAWLDDAAVGLRDPDAADIVREMQTLLPPVDVAVLTDEYGEDSAAAMKEALRTGVNGWLDDDLEIIRPWGFELASIVVPAFIWQGEADLMVPFAHGQWLAANVPGARVHLLPGQGHMSIAVGTMDQMVAELAATL